MTQQLPPALFRFVGVRRPAPPPPPLPPPSDDLVAKAFDFSGALLPVVAQVLHRDDRQLAVKLVDTLLRLPQPLASAAAGVRVIRRRAAVDADLTLADLRPPTVETAQLQDLAQRSTTVVVLERWLGMRRSPALMKAIQLLRGVAIARLATSSLDDRHLVADLVRGRTLVLPDVVRDAEPPARPGFDPLRVRGDLKRLTARRAALGHDGEPTLDKLRGNGFADLTASADRAADAAQHLDLPPDVAVSQFSRVLDAEIAGSPLDPGDISTVPQYPIPLPPPALPALDGRARVLGRGDLMVVRMSHLRYDVGEIAYVENVLKSELRGRTVVVDTRTSQKVIESASDFSEATQELTTDERFELQDAASSTNTTTNTMSAGVSISGGYGPVTVGIDVNAGHTSTTTESNSSSSDYAKDVTDRATQSMRSQSSTKTITTTSTRTAETDKHDFDNREGDGHVIGIYRWLEKVDRAQVYNYGERLLLEFVVPEPAAQHVYLATAAETADQPTPPKPLNFGPDDLNENNYITYGQRYDTDGLTRPPQHIIGVPATFAFQPARTTKEVNPDPKQDPPPVMMANGVLTGEVTIPSGYAATTVITSVVYGGDLAGGPPPEDANIPDYVLHQAPVYMSVGGQRFTMWAGDFAESVVTQLEQKRTGNLPIAIGSQQIDGQAIAVRVLAERTTEAYKAWQQDTFATIQQAYLSQQRDYENAMSVAQLKQGYAALTPPDVNRMIEVEELTRGCQTILTGQDFTLFGSVTFTAGEIPGIDLDEAWVEADAIQFFSDVLEWSLMTYLFYPYQWAGRDRWAELSARTSSDLLHQAFLQAGAARVVVPVREGFEHAIGRYLKTGEIPSWGPEPWRGRPVHYPTVDELIADANDRPEGEVAVGEPWEVVSPTALIYLQEDADLNPDG